MPVGAVVRQDDLQPGWIVHREEGLDGAHDGCCFVGQVSRDDRRRNGRVAVRGGRWGGPLQRREPFCPDQHAREHQGHDDHDVHHAGEVETCAVGTPVQQVRHHAAQHEREHDLERCSYTVPPTRSERAS